MERIKRNDIIVVSGTTTSKDGIISRHTILATVVEVGKYDLFAKEINSVITSSAVFRVSKKRCVKVRNAEIQPTEKIINPKIGDLVLCYYESYQKTVLTKGILTEIIDKPGRPSQAKIIQGSKSEVVPLDSLIVLEH